MSGNAAYVGWGQSQSGSNRFRLWVNAERTVLVRQWDDEKVEIAVRETPDHTWGPPIYLTEERV